MFPQSPSVEFKLNLLLCVNFSGMGPVHMNEVECSGFEKSITECSFNKEALGCSHEEDAAVRCNVPKMGFQERVGFHFTIAKYWLTQLL